MNSADKSSFSAKDKILFYKELVYMLHGGVSIMQAVDTIKRSTTNYALKTIWENDNYFNARSMDVYITKLRKILKEDPSLEIRNVHGKGYRLNTTLGDGVPEDLVTKI